MRDTSLSTVDGRPTLRIERRLAHPQHKVWRAVTDPAHLSRWYPFRAVELDLRVGGKILFDDDAGTTMHAEVTELDPPRAFAFSEHAPDAMTRESDDLVRIELRPDGDGCLLIFTHTFDDRPAAASYGTGWTACLDGLGMLLDGREVEFTGDMAARHEEFVDHFGLGEGTAEDTGDGWLVRFERQLTKPAGTAWQRLGGERVRAPGDVVPGGFTVQEFAAGPAVLVSRDAAVEYEWLTGGEPAGRVRFELSEGTGHGARLVLVQTGTDAAARDTALRCWREHIERFARSLAG